MRFAKCKKMSNIYLNTEQQSMPPIDNQIEGCHGHYISINAEVNDIHTETVAVAMELIQRQT